MKKIFYKFSFFITAVLLFNLPLLAQNQTIITGIVTDGKAPLVRASITEKGLSHGTVTDNDGRFKITLRGTKHVLVFSATGFAPQEITAKQGQPLNIVLVADSHGLDDVVVLGYGQQVKRITVVGSVSSITGAELRQSPSASLQNSLIGRLPGLFSEQRSGQPGADASSIQIRGYNTFTSGATTPLIIVDDVEFSYAQLQQIDPNEVESLSILKDASTTAIYGVRGSNGVIIITTRRGKSGRPELNFRNELGLQAPTRLAEINDGYTTLQLFKESLLVQGLDAAALYPQYFAGNNLDLYKNNTDPYGHPFVDWWKVLLKKTSPQDRINFDISGGSRIVKYFISLGYITQGGLYKDFTKDQSYNDNYFYNRYNFRSNIDIDPTKSLHIAMNLSGRFSITNSPNDAPWNGGASTLQYLWNSQLSSFAYPVYNPNGSFGGSSSGATSSSYDKPNPVANLMYSGYNRTYNYNMSFVTKAQQKLDFITKGLSAMGTISYSGDDNSQKSLTRAIGTIPTYYYNSTNDTYLPVTSSTLYRMGPMTRTNTALGTSQLLNFQASLNYAQNFGRHNVSGLLLFNQTTTTTNTYASSVVTPGVPANVRGFVGRISYNFASKYLLDVSMARNGSDRFGNGKQYGYFPSVGVGYNLAEEPFFKNNVSFINLFKIRGSYGMVGNDQIGTGYQYLYQQVYNTGQGGYATGVVPTTGSGVTEGTLGNPNVTWAKTRKTDVGVDLQLFKGKLSITADYFHDYTYDILLQRSSVSGVFGVGLPAVNLGKMSNAGIDGEIKYSGKAGKVSFSIGGTYTYAKNKVIFRDLPTQKYDWLDPTGKPFGSIFGYTWTGQFYQSVADIVNSPQISGAVPLKNIYPGDLKMADLNGDGKIDQYDQGYLGNNQPQLVAGLNLQLQYKGFDISMLFQGAFDYIVSMQRGLVAYDVPSKVSVPFNLGRWTPENAATATFPTLAMGGVDKASTTSGAASNNFWYRSGNYVRFKQYEIGYTLPSKLTKKWNMKSVRFYSTGYNLGLLYVALPVFVDPESVASTSAGEYPQQKIFNFGVSIGL